MRINLRPLNKRIAFASFWRYQSRMAQGLHKGIISGFLFALNTLFWCVCLYLFLIVKVLIPLPAVHRWTTAMMVRIGELWISGNDLNIALTQNVKWDIRLPATLSMDRSYLVCANHQSWMDIVILQHIFNRKIPFLRFFLKQELLYVPLLGAAWWGLDYPFMKRHSKEYLRKYPEKRGQDLKTTLKATEKFKHTKVSILNFLEGTRFTQVKHDRQQSPFKHLLFPKAGGFGFVLETMKDKFYSVLDVTIVYPQGPISFGGALCGQLKEVIVDVEEIIVPEELLNGKYLEDPEFRAKVHTWVRQLWERKDQKMESLLRA